MALPKEEENLFSQNCDDHKVLTKNIKVVEIRGHTTFKKKKKNYHVGKKLREGVRG